MALILDTGPLYASLDRSDADHVACSRLIASAAEVLVIPGPVLVEVDYLVHSRLHAGAMLALLDDIAVGAYRVEDPVLADYSRIAQICADYADMDAGLVDASVLALVERLGETKLATLDNRHFGVLRPRPFPGIRHHMQAAGEEPLHIVLIHGMGKGDWARPDSASASQAMPAIHRIITALGMTLPGMTGPSSQRSYGGVEFYSFNLISSVNLVFHEINYTRHLIAPGARIAVPT